MSLDKTGWKDMD